VSGLTWNESDQLHKVFAHAAQGALVEWGIDGEADDLTQQLWEWYLQRPTTQTKMTGLSEPEQIVTAKRAAHQMISGNVLEGNIAGEKVIYSTDSVREALHGLSTNKYLLEILPEAEDILQARHEEYAEALRSRYTDGVIPLKEGGEAMVLSRAVKALTDEVNVLYLSSDDSGVGRRDSASPNHRKRGGGYSDPTSNIALLLMGNADEREAFYEELDDGDWSVGFREDEPASDPINIMDSAFNGMPRSEFYRGQVFPELFPHEDAMLVERWSRQDREMFCGPVG
jgi:hypothetical protein